MNVYADIFFSYMDPKKCIHNQLFDMNIFFTCKDMAKKFKYIKKKLFSDIYLYYYKSIDINHFCSRTASKHCMTCLKISMTILAEYIKYYGLNSNLDDLEKFLEYFSANFDKQKKLRNILYGIQQSDIDGNLDELKKFLEHVSANSDKQIKPRKRLYGIQYPGQLKPNSMKDRRYSKIKDQFPKTNNKANRYLR